MARPATSMRAPTLFVSEQEAARLAGQTPEEWKAKAIVLERDGMPKCDPIMGGRYWPAVVAFFHRRYGLHNVGLHPLDGQENLNEL